MPDWYLRVAMPAVIGFLAAGMLAMGLIPLLTRRPALMHARWLLGFVLLAFLPGAVQPFLKRTGLGHDPGTPSRLVEWISPAMFVVLAVVFGLAMRGYVVIGVTLGSMREALFSALARLQLPYEETLGSIRLPSVPAELQVAVQSWIGTGQLKPRTRGARDVTARIAAGMRAHFASGAVELNMICPIAYVVMALLLVVTDVSLVMNR